MNLEQAVHKYKITFPGGKIIYLPIEGIIIDPLKKKSISLPEKRNLSLLPNSRSQNIPTSYDFMPVCLTVYASHQCNLNCTYCYIPQKDTYPAEFIDPAVVSSGAQIVASNCLKRKLPFVVGFHGGNEPLLHPEKLETYLGVCETAAKKNNLEFLPFCTTNGVIPEKTARWAADRFFGITLSWDGPPDLHNAHRKDKSKGLTSRSVENTARVFSESKKSPNVYQIRCTITSTSVEKMLEITRYFRMAGVKGVEFYPVFQNSNQSIPTEMMPDPEKFVYHFLQAKSFGDYNNIRITFSGARITEHHSRYCMILQDNLTVTPDGHLTNCFHHTQNYDQVDSDFFYGKYNHDSNSLEYDHEKLDHLIGKNETGLDICSDCFNQFHCSLGCPEVCPFNNQYNKTIQPDCIKEKWLGLASLLEQTGHLVKFTTESAFLDFFQHVSYQRI